MITDIDISNGLNLYTAVDAIKEIKSGRVTAVDLMQSYINRIEEIEHEIKAWVYFDKEKLLQQAAAIDEKLKKGKNLGVLCGIPVGIKDIFNTADMPTDMGSPIWDGFTPGNDARVISYIKWADGIIAGKTVTAEFAVHTPGKTVNPHSYAHSPGTSSSGSAAAVASFMVPLALGTQTAGSTIRPASYCGIYGFKPSFGIIPRTGVLKTLDTLDHVTFFSRSVEDIHLMLDILRVKGPNFPFVHKFMDNLPKINEIDRYMWKVAFVRAPGWEYAEKYAKDAISTYVSRISREKEIVIEEVKLAEDFNFAHDIHGLVYNKALSYYFKDEYEKHREKVSKLFLEMVEKGRKISDQEYRKCLQKQNELIHLLDRFFEKYDIIVTLSTAGEAPKLDEQDKKDSCLIWTLCHVPAINLPLFRGPNGLPFGAQIVSRRYQDYKMLNFVRFLKRKKLLKDLKAQ